MTKFWFYTSVGCAAFHFIACFWLAVQGIQSWSALIMGVFFLLLAYIHHRRLTRQR